MRSILIIAAAALLAAAAIGQTPQAPKKAQPCADTDYDCLIKLYAKAVKDKPKDAENHYNLGLAHQLKGQFKEAVAAYDNYLGAKMTGQANLADGYNNRAIANHKLGKNEASLADYAKAIELNPSSARFFTNRGNLYTDLKRFDEAVADYSKAITFDQAYVSAYAGRAIVYGSKEEFARAIDDLTKVIELDPTDVTTFYNRGVYYSQKQDYKMAKEDFSKYIDSNPANKMMLADCLLNRAITNYMLNDDAGAVADLTKALDANPKLVNAYVARSRIYRDQNKIQLAEADEKKVAELQGKP
ncbi:MAG: tetratricopeptide repeat protein [Acidobacteria bacterium]|nr:tetratricopeptide repeat protein [Acidobacteriota bacterium]